MQHIQFDPKITTDLSLAWQRPSNGQASDMFADLLADRMKQNVEAERRQPAPKRHQHASEPLSGRPSRVAIAHGRTMRGEAKETEDTDSRLADRKPCATEDTGAAAPAETAPTEDNAEATTPQPETTEAQTQVADSADQQPQSADPAAVAIVSTQTAEQPENAGEDVLTLEPEIAAAPEGEGLVPVQGEPASATQDEPQASAEATVEQQAVAAMVEAGLSDGAIALASTDAAPTLDAEAPVIVTQATPPAAIKPTAQDPLPQMPEASEPIAEIKAAPQPQTDRRGPDIKVRPNAPRQQGASADPKPGTPAAAPSAPVSQPAPLQPSGAGAFDGLGDPLDQPLSPDGAGPGWTLHLAQGAAARRPDFVAQLRQHLQNLPAHEQVAVHVQRALRDGSGKFSVQLSPAELGRIHVKLQIDEDKRVTAAVSVERPSTLELLQRDIKELERALLNAGLNLEGGDLSFSLGHGTDQDFAQDLNHSAAPAAGGLVPDAEAEEPDRSAVQVTDTATGVVDLQV